MTATVLEISSGLPVRECRAPLEGLTSTQTTISLITTPKAPQQAIWSVFIIKGTQFNFYFTNRASIHGNINIRKQYILLLQLLNHNPSYQNVISTTAFKHLCVTGNAAAYNSGMVSCTWFQTQTWKMFSKMPRKAKTIYWFLIQNLNNFCRIGKVIKSFLWNKNTENLSPADFFLFCVINSSCWTLRYPSVYAQ